MRTYDEMTPREYATEALGDSALFCDILNEARNTGAEGWWHGSAFQCHPCGLISGTIMMHNDWTIYNSCGIKITDGEGWSTSVISTDSRYRGNPYPEQVNGKVVRVWSSGTWKNEKFKSALEGRIIAILDRAVEHIRRVNKERAEKRALELSEAESEQEALEANALRKAAPL